MKKSSNDIIRSLFLMAAMIIIGAGSAFAQTESENYFSLTKNAGTESASTSYYTTFAEAVDAADDGDLITLLKDYTATAPVYISESITLDLNDHTISFNFDDNLITVKSGAILTVINGTLTAVDDYGRNPINVNTGGTLHVTGVSIDGRNHPGIYIDGTAVIDDCDLGGDCGFESNGTTYVTKSNLSGKNYGIWVVGGTTTIGEDVYIPSFACYGICYNDGAVILNALPTFGKSRDPEIYDITIPCGLSLTFGEGTFNTPDQPISIYIKEDGVGVDPTIYTNPIATNYSKYVKDGGKVIDPNDVFSWYNYYDNYTDGFTLNADGEVIFNNLNASMTSYDVESGTVTTILPFPTALKAAQAGYKTATETGSTEFIPTVTLLADVVAKEKGFVIGDGETTTKVKLDLNDHTISFNFDDNLITVKSGAMLTVINTDTYTDKKGTLTAGDDYGCSPINVNTGGTLYVTGVSIDGRDHPGIYIDGTAVIDDCKISGKNAINIHGTATITNSEISGGASSALLVGEEVRENGVVTQVYNGCLTIGKEVYISHYTGRGIDYYAGTVILNALPTFGEKPTTSSTTRGTTREPEYHEIMMSSGLSLSFGEGSFKTPDKDKRIKIYIKEDGVGVAPATYTNAFTTNYSKYVKDGGKVIDPNEVFIWAEDDNPDGFRLDAAGEMVFSAVKASVSTYNAGSAPTIANYTTLADALAAAQAGYKTATETGSTEFIPTVTLLADVDAKETCFSIGDGSKTTKMTLDLNDHNITGDTDIDDILIVINDGVTLTLVDNGDDNGKMGSIKNNDKFNHGAIIVASGGRLNAKGVIISSRDGDTINNYGTAEFDDCVISGNRAINIYGTATITNSDISGGNASAIIVGGRIIEGGVVTQVYDGCLTIGKDVYISGGYPCGINYQVGTVILKALPTYGERPTTSSTTRAGTRDYFYYDIGIKSGLSFIFEEGSFKTPDKTISIYITDNGAPIDPATYTNAITTNYSDYVIDGGEVIDPNKVFRWAAEFTHGFRLDAAGEVFFNHAAVTVTSYSGTSTPTTTPYYNFSEAIAAANSGYKTASEAGGTEFIPTLKMLDDVSINTGVEIGNGETTKKVTLDLNDHELKGNCDAGTIIVKGKATLNLVDTGTDNSKGVVWNSKNETGTNCIYVWDGGEFTATGVSIKSDMGTALLNNGSTTVGEGVSFSGNREASIYNNYQGTLTLTAWPTFGVSETEGYADIKLSNGRTVTFGGTGLGIPTQITLRVVDDEIHDISAGFLPVAITTNYSDYVKDGGKVIDPNKVFRWYNDDVYFGVALNADGEAAIYAPTTFIFADEQEWMTWCDKNEWRLPDGIEAYCITGVTASAITIEKLTGTTIPAYEPLLLKKVGTEDFTAILTAKPVAPSSGYDAATGIVTATVSGATFYGNAADDAIYTVEGGFVHVGIDGTGTASYVLRDGQFILVDENQGLAAHRCVLNVSAANNNARVLTINDDATGITAQPMFNGQSSMFNEDSWYSIDGRKLDGMPAKKGLYINNGRKVVIK